MLSIRGYSECIGSTIPGPNEVVREGLSLGLAERAGSQQRCGLRPSAAPLLEKIQLSEEHLDPRHRRTGRACSSERSLEDGR